MQTVTMIRLLDQKLHNKSPDLRNIKPLYYILHLSPLLRELPVTPHPASHQLSSKETFRYYKRPDPNRRSLNKPQQYHCIRELAPRLNHPRTLNYS
ncbi:hypothetical protein D3C74_240150 [compost metagenome]